jgi:hypothetical protein
VSHTIELQEALSQGAVMVAIASNYSRAAFYSPNATARAAKPDSGPSSSASATPNDPADQEPSKPDAVKTLDQARLDLLARRKQDALDRLDHARKEIELLRTLGGDEKSIAWKAKQVAEQIGKAAVEYGDAAAGIRRSGDSATPDQPADGSAADANATSTDRDSAAKQDAPSANDASTQASKQPSSASTPTSTTSDPSAVTTDADAVKAFSDAAGQLKRVFEELVLKGKIKHTSSRDWIEAERARAKMGQEIQDLSDEIEVGASLPVAANGPATQTSLSISINIVA